MPHVLRLVIGVSIAFLMLVGSASAQPGQPAILSASATGGVLTITWSAPVSGSSVTGYRLDFRDGTSRQIASLTLSNQTTFSTQIPAGVQGTFSATVTALSGFVPGPPSAPVSFTIGGMTAPPSTPTDVRVNVATGRLTVTWTTPPGGTVPDSHLLDIRMPPSPAIIAELLSGPQPTFSITVPEGVTGLFSVSITAVAGGVESAPSQAVQFILTPSGCTGPPPTPLNLRGTIANGMLTIQWEASTGATGYGLKAGTSPNNANLFNGPIGNRTSLSAAVPSNFRAFVRVAATNACGNSNDSAEVLVPSGLYDGTWSGPAFPFWDCCGPEIPGYRSGAGGAVVGGKLLVIAGDPGYGGSGSTNAVSAFDPVTRQWTSVANAPTSRAYASAVTVGNKVYAIGGATNGNCNQQVGVVELYDPALDRWSSLPTMPFPRGGIPLAAVATRIYAIGGGCGNVNYTDRVDIFDTVSETWSQGAALPTRRETAAAAVIGSKIYVVGGFIRTFPQEPPFGSWTNIIEVFDTATGTWDTSRAPMPTARGNTVVVALNGRLHVIGGRNNSGTLRTHEVYDPATNTWTTEPRLQYGRASSSGGVIDGRIYLIAGLRSGSSGQPDFYDPTIEIYRPRSISFTIQGDALTSVQFAASVSSNDVRCDRAGANATRFFDPPVPIINGQFTATSADPTGSVTFELSSTFSTTTSALGRLRLTYRDLSNECTGTLDAPWTATRQQ